VPLSDLFPESTSPYALEGTVAHLVVENIASEFFDAEDIEYLASDGEQVAFPDSPHLKRDFDPVVIDGDMVRHATNFLEYVNEIPGEKFFEVQVDLDRWIPGSFGKVDALVVNHDQKVITVIDYKYGQGKKVFAEENEQIMLYALGALEELHFEGHINIEDNAELSSWMVDLVIYQPRIDHIDPWNIESAADLVDWAGFEAKPAALEAASMKLDGATFNPSEKACLWCPAKGECEAHARYMLEAAGQEVPDLQKPLMSAEDLDGLYPLLGGIASWIKAVEGAVEAKLRDGAEMVYAKLVRSNTHRKFEDPDAAREFLLSKKSIVKADIITESLITPTKALDLVKAKFKRPNAIIQELNENFIIKPEGGVTVAPMDDKRPAWRPIAAADEFETLNPEDFET
jgi:hypothetical protein